jgi:N4-gp56 family major capsid protein
MAADNVTNTGGLSTAVATYYDRLFLDRLVKELHFDEFGQKKQLPKGSGTTIQFQRFTNFSANTTALTEGTVPSGLTLQSTTLTAIPLQYGDFVSMSDRLILESIDPIVKDALELLSYRAALSMDTLIRNDLNSNATSQYAGGAGSEGATSAVVTASEIRKLVRTLRTSDVLPMEGGDYAAIIHPATAFDLMSDTASGGWMDINKYTTTGPAYKGEVGKLYGVRFVTSTNIGTGTGASSATTYRNFVIGKGAYGLVDVAGGGLKTYTKQLGSAGSADPLDQIATVGYKFYFVNKTLDANRVIRLVGCTG